MRRSKEGKKRKRISHIKKKIAKTQIITIAINIVLFFIFLMDKKNHTQYW
jgi:uncharacterized membrane protein YqhA